MQEAVQEEAHPGRYSGWFAGGRARVWLGLALLALVFGAAWLLGRETLRKDQAAGWEKLLHAPPVQELSSKGDFLDLRFIRQVLDMVQDPGALQELVEISPRAEFQVIALYDNLLRIVPEQHWESGREYQVVLYNRPPLHLPPDLPAYRFSFRVPEQSFSLHVDGLWPHPGDPDRMRLSGVLETADRELSQRVETLLRARLEEQELPLQWFHAQDGTRHTFTLESIERVDRERELLLSWDGGRIGAGAAGSRTVKVPPLGQFELLRFRTDNQEGYVRMEFSGLLDPLQDLRGLVRLNGSEVSAEVRDSVLLVYPPEHPRVPAGEALEVVVSGALRGARGNTLGRDAVARVTFRTKAPQVRFAGAGTILPGEKQLIVPVEGVNVHSLQVTAFRVARDNVGQYLQDNKLSGGNASMAQVGRYLWRRTVHLEDALPERWTRYHLDLADLLREQPGDLFRFTLSINRSNSMLECSEQQAAKPALPEAPYSNYNSPRQREYGEMMDDLDERQLDRLVWSRSEDPCSDAYYHSRYNRAEVSASRNFLASNLGLLAKRGRDGRRLYLTVTDLRDALPRAGVRLRAYGYQHQPLGEAFSDQRGLAFIEAEGVPFYLVAEQDGERGFLGLAAEHALPSSHFAVGGVRRQDGIKGRLYTARGVWRPGDRIHLMLAVEDQDERLPESHPATLKLKDPRGRLVETLVNTEPVDGFYAFSLATDAEAPTGRWSAQALLGGRSFQRALLVETITPNRIKLNLQLGGVDADAGDALFRDQDSVSVPGQLRAQWLHGADASDLKADLELSLSSRRTVFERFPGYVFDDPVRRRRQADVRKEPQQVFQGRLDAAGTADFTFPMPSGGDPPGMLSALFTARVFERGGDYSSSQFRLPYHVFPHYVGLHLPQADAEEQLRLNVPHQVSIASVNARGEPVSLGKLEITLYEIGWRWWWDQRPEKLAQYLEQRASDPVRRELLVTENGLTNWELRFSDDNWGRYLLRVCDLEGGHCSGRILYTSWRGWDEAGGSARGPGASRLRLEADQERYRVGDIAAVTLPALGRGRALLSLEAGDQVLEQRWLEVEHPERPLRVHVPVTAAMAPNVYVHVTVLQPHSERDNDRPIRLYGILPLHVDDPATYLRPVLATPGEWEPESTVTVEVSEAEGRPMTYTLALVDEGLLSLTRFRTPDLHAAFYSQEALGVDTWDLYDDVVGAYGGELERLLSLGGDEQGEEEEGDPGKQRFPPVVHFLGPERLEAGAVARHEITLPPYLGEVRLMLVAGRDGAYGKAEKSVTVRKPLMMFPVLPRTLMVEDEVLLPVTLFVDETALGSVEVSVQADGPLTVDGDGRQRVQVDKPGEYLVFLRLRAGLETGASEVRLEARNGAHRSEQTVHLEVSNPQQAESDSRQLRLEPGEEWSGRVRPLGVPGTNTVVLEVSPLPPLNLERRLGDLVRYPHGCSEQTVSAAFSQVYLAELLKLSPQHAEQVAQHVRAAIGKLRRMQHSSGAFGLWPGIRPQDWLTGYVGHFMLEATRAGYRVPGDMLLEWRRHIVEAVQGTWVPRDDDQELVLVYRLYLLALAGAPELGVMNHARERLKRASAANPARWLLAAAYRVAGQSDAAAELAQPEVPLRLPSHGFRNSRVFGSELRDLALILLSLVELKQPQRAAELAEQISTQLAGPGYLTTQESAFALVALSALRREQQATDFGFSYEVDPGGRREVSVRGVWLHQESLLPELAERGGLLRVRNPGPGVLYLVLTRSGLPAPGSELELRDKLDLQVQFLDLDGNLLQVENLPLGADLEARVMVLNRQSERLENLALTQLLPSGWQNHNPRLAAAADHEQQQEERQHSADSRDNYDYRDLRDDRVLTYFDLDRHEQKTFSMRFNASFPGRYFLPAWRVEAMYDEDIRAQIRGRAVRVRR